ncbi:ABC transporter ATP-binding protein, partial [Pseudomonas syringae]|nr:ABC transporter ATP-binding protein [Pseudomonas syringae]
LVDSFGLPRLNAVSVAGETRFEPAF